jgi:hypothetical protein
MPQAQAKPTTVEEFLSWQRWQGFRDEFDGVRPLVATGGTAERTAIASGQWRTIDDRLMQPFQVPGDLKVVVGGRARHPDLVVTCPTIHRGSDLILEPLIVFDVLSTSTEVVDRNAKADGLGVPPAVGRRVRLAQTIVETAILSCEGDTCARGRLSGRDAIPRLTEFSVGLRLAEVYRPIVLDN